MQVINPLENRRSSALVPCSYVKAVIPNDDLEFSVINRAVWVANAGNLHVGLLDGMDVTIQNIQAGSLLPIVVKRVLATGTTATGIQLWW